MTTINDFEVGTKIRGSNGYSIVKECVHGNKYYAFVSQNCPAEWEQDYDNIPYADDDDENLIPCCG